jgi:hypothetical protein
MTQRLRVLKILTLVAGLTLMSGGTSCALLYLFLPFFYHGPDVLATNLTLASLAALTLTLGFTLAYQARNSLKGRPSTTFRPPSPWFMVLVFFLCLIVGQAMLSLVASPVLTSLAFPPLHVLAAVSPALAILAFVARRTRAASWRTVSLEVSHGALLAPMGALAAELVALLVVGLVIAFVFALTPGGIEQLLELSINLQDPAWIEDPANLAQLVLSPWALTIIVLIFVVIAPLLEEFLKGLGVLLLGYRLRGEAQALLWGVACGAGFALAESLFNGSIALEGWGAVMIMRWGASLMHCVGTGIVGLGWHQALAGRRPWRLLAAHGASWGIHALWNGAALAVFVPSLLVVAQPQDFVTQSVASLVVLSSLAFLVLLTISMAIVLLYLTRRVGGPSSGTVMSDERSVAQD